VTVQEGTTRNVWVGSLDGPLARLTFGNDDSSPVWTADGKRITFGAGIEGRYNLFQISADGSPNTPERLTSSDSPQRPTSWSPQGNILLYNEITDASNGLDIWQRNMEGTPMARPFIKTAFDEFNASFSPDGRWVAYVSNETGRNEIYVQAFPGPGGKQLISSDGGIVPVWSPNSREIFYDSGTAIMAIPVLDASARTGVPIKVAAHRHLKPGMHQDFGVSRDSERFLILESVETASDVSRLNVVLDWFEELRRVTSK
jgi:Tol biopolymer transport system component